MCNQVERYCFASKLEPGDMIVLKAKYHRKCLVNLYNRSRALESAEQALVFKLTDLAFMYKTRLEQLGANVAGL